MTYSQIQTKTPSSCTCAFCPKFNDFNEPKGRGWCTLFDKVAYQHHALTVDCQLNLPPETDTEAYNEEDKIHCKYQEGDIVKIIDPTTDHTQWETFVVVGKKHNSNAFQTIKAYLTEPEWYILIATPRKPVTDMYWKPETDICFSEQSEFIDTSDVF